VFKDDGGEFHGGVYGDARSDDPRDGSTAYVAPIHREHFDYNIVYGHRTDFMVGRLADIRRRFNALATKTPPAWRFATNRQHWIRLHASDQGLPLRGAWRVRFASTQGRLESPPQSWRAEQAPRMTLNLAASGHLTALRLLWKRLGDERYDAARSLIVKLLPDGKFHPHVLNLASAPGYRGLLIGLALEPVNAPHPDDELQIRSLVPGKEPVPRGAAQ